jgi:hypothetical protein
LRLERFSIRPLKAITPLSLTNARIQPWTNHWRFTKLNGTR